MGISVSQLNNHLDFPFVERGKLVGELIRADQFRPPPLPKVGSEQLKKAVDKVLNFNANLTPEQKAIVEFIRDGPRSTEQSGLAQICRSGFPPR